MILNTFIKKKLLYLLTNIIHIFILQIKVECNIKKNRDWINLKL